MPAPCSTSHVLRPFGGRSGGVLGLSLAWLLLLGNLGVVVWLWYHGGNVTHVRTTGDLLTSIARITGLVGSLLALVQVVLLARLPWLERLVGFDRLTVWHRWNGHACLDLILAHVVFSVWGYSLLDKVTIPKEISTMLGGGIYPGMITATIGTGLLIAVVVSSIVIVRRRLRYETWYAVHLAVYAGIALAWFHQIPTGNELVLDRVAADYWRGALPRHARRADRVPGARARAECVPLPVAGRRGDDGRPRRRVGADQRQAPRAARRDAGTVLRLALPRPPALVVGPPVLAVGGSRRTIAADHRQGPRRPHVRPRLPGSRHARRRRRPLRHLHGGLAPPRQGSPDRGRHRDHPIRALLETMRGDLVVLYRVVEATDAIFRDELERLAARAGATLHLIVGDHTTPEGRRLLAPDHLRQLVPDLAEREVFLCGPPPMTRAISRAIRAADVPAKHIHTERFALI